MHSLYNYYHKPLFQLKISKELVVHYIQYKEIVVSSCNHNFIKPQWLCNLMSTVITVENNYIKDGRIAKFNFTQLFKEASKDYSEEFLEHYLIVLK